MFELRIEGSSMRMVSIRSRTAAIGWKRAVFARPEVFEIGRKAPCRVSRAGISLAGSRHKSATSLSIILDDLPYSLTTISTGCRGLFSVLRVPPEFIRGGVVRKSGSDFNLLLVVPMKANLM